MGISAKTFVVFVAVSAVLGAGVLVWHHWSPRNGRAGNKPARYSIGLIFAPSNAFHEHAAAALHSLIDKDALFCVSDFMVSSTTDLIAVDSVCEEALNSSCDLIMCVGLKCSLSIAKFLKKRGNCKPSIFIGVVDASKYGLADSLCRPGQAMTGVETSSFVSGGSSPLDVLLAVKPRAKRILLPYAEGAGTNELRVHEIEKRCAELGLAVTLLRIQNASDTVRLVAGLIVDHDVLMYLEADPIAPSAPALGKLASQHGVTMFAGSVDGIKDAAVGYLHEPAEFAEIAFEMARNILINKTDPAAIPVRQIDVERRRVIINTRLCAEQDLADLDPESVRDALRRDPKLAPVHNALVVY